MTSIIHTTKWTCDREGNWRRVPAILAKCGNGYVEALPAAPEPSDPSFNRVDVSALIEATRAKSLLKEDSPDA